MTLYVITGPPAAGKTTWALDHAQPGDIVIDYDRLALALTGQGADTHQHPPHLAAVTRRARNAAIDEAVQHRDTTDVYLIHTQPSAGAQRYYDSLGAQIITIDPGRDTVTRRCRDSRPHTSLAAVRDWYATHTTPPTVTEARPASMHTSAAPSRRW